MPILNNASDVRYGNTLVERVYMRNVIVWERSRPDPDPAVPDGYTKYDYIETSSSNGGNRSTSFFRTGFIPTDTNFAIELDFVFFPGYTTSNYCIGKAGTPIIGLMEGADASEADPTKYNWLIFDYTTADGFRTVFNKTTTTTDWTTGTWQKVAADVVGDNMLTSTRTYMKLSPNKNEWTYMDNGVEKTGYVVPDEVQSIPTNLEVLINTINKYRDYGNRYDNGKFSDPSSFPFIYCVPRFASHTRYYGVKIRKNGRLAKMYVPCTRNSDGQVGLWEMIDEEFITPTLNTSGGFIVGNDT